MFDNTTFALFILGVAVVYAVLSQVLQRKIGNFKRVKEIQDTFKSINDDLNAATKANDKAKVEEVLKRQADSTSMITEMMVLQFKPLILILVVFFATTWALGQLEPYRSDDMTIKLFDNGNTSNCDMKSGDGIYSACFTLAPPMQKGAWVIYADAIKDGKPVGSNGTILYYAEGKKSDVYVPPAKGEMLALSVDKPLYSENETARITAVPSGNPGADYVDAKLDMGTEFYVDLPFAVPLIFMELKRVVGGQSFFVLSVFVISLVISFAFSAYLQKL